jgi:hypothetical protein
MAGNKVSALQVLAQSKEMIGANELLRTPLELLSPEAQVVAWQLLDLLEKKAMKPRKDELREALLDLVDDEGISVGTSKVLEISGAKVTSVKRAGKVNIDIPSLVVVLRNRGIDPDSVMKVEVKKVLDDTALENLIISGRLSKEDVYKFTTEGDETRVLRVKKSREVLSLLP